MRQYERSGVIVDQCGDCRGIFLDRGELERLTEAETRWAERTYRPAPPRRERYDYDDYRRRPQKRKKGWIEELFD